MNPIPFNKVKLDPHIIKTNTMLLDLVEVVENQDSYFICYLPKKTIVCYKGWRILSMLEDDPKLLVLKQCDHGTPRYKVFVSLPTGFILPELVLNGYTIYGSNPICPPF